MKDRQAKTRAHVRHGGPRIGLGRLHRMSLWLLKHHLRSPTSSGRGFHQIIPITCHQVTTSPTICPKAIQDTITQACLPTLYNYLDVCKGVILKLIK